MGKESKHCDLPAYWTSGSAKEQIEKRFTQINELTEHHYLFALLFHRGNSRAFIIVSSENHKGMLLERAEKFMRGPWSQHFELITSDRLIE